MYPEQLVRRLMEAAQKACLPGHRFASGSPLPGDNRDLEAAVTALEKAEALPAVAPQPDEEAVEKLIGAARQVCDPQNRTPVTGQVHPGRLRDLVAALNALGTPVEHEPLLDIIGIGASEKAGSILDCGDEFVIPFQDKQIRCPAYPAECDYVRITDLNGVEIVYWHSDEWRDEPQAVMGAFMAAVGTSLSSLERLCRPPRREAGDAED